MKALEAFWKHMKHADKTRICVLNRDFKKRKVNKNQGGDRVKARIPVYYTAKERKAMCDEVYAEWRKIEQREKRIMAERCLKVIFYVLNRDFGFGKKRAAALYNTCGEFLMGADHDEGFYERIDRVVIDQLKLNDFSRDYTDKGKAIRMDG